MPVTVSPFSHTLKNVTFILPSIQRLASLVAQLVKKLPAMWETWVRSLGWEDPLEKGKATHSSILAWRIPWTLQSMGPQRVRHVWVTFTSTLARTSNTMLNQSGKSEHPHSIPDLRRNVFSFSPLSMTLAVGLSDMAFVEACTLYSHVLSFLFFFNHKQILNFVKAFFASTEINVILIQFNVLSYTDQFADVCVLSRSVIPDSLRPHGL